MSISIKNICEWLNLKIKSLPYLFYRLCFFYRHSFFHEKSPSIGAHSGAPMEGYISLLISLAVYLDYLRHDHAERYIHLLVDS